MTAERHQRFTKETELGPAVVAWLEAHAFEVYQEVDVGRIADVVGVCGPQVVVVELKLSLSWELLSQARGWRWCAHQVWVAVPQAKDSDGRQMAVECFERMGVGVLEVSRVFDGSPWVTRDRARPTFNRSARQWLKDPYMKKALREENRTLAKAGSPARDRTWTPFKLTCDRLREYLREHPGATIAEAVRDVPHHYMSDKGARGRLVHLIEEGVIDGIRVEHEGRRVRLFLTEASKA